ncbi:hypothetical protein PENTCL1PPCAC_25735, partial [Pristionchus entomophagus]
SGLMEIPSAPPPYSEVIAHTPTTLHCPIATVYFPTTNHINGHEQPPNRARRIMKAAKGCIVVALLMIISIAAFLILATGEAHRTQFNPWIVSITLIHVIFLISGFYGIDKKKPYFILPIIIVTGIFLVLVVIATAVAVFWLIMGSGGKTGSQLFPVAYVLIFAGALIFCAGYFIQHSVEARRIIIEEKEMGKYLAVNTS